VTFAVGILTSENGFSSISLCLRALKATGQIEERIENPKTGRTKIDGLTWNTFMPQSRPRGLPVLVHRQPLDASMAAVARIGGGGKKVRRQGRFGSLPR
jgi:hypothetical protein